MKAMLALYKPTEKIIIAVCILFVVFGGITTFFPEAYRIIADKKPFMVYQGYQAPLSGILEIACDPNGNLYVLANQSDCIVVFSPDGDVRYSYFFISRTSGSHEMIAMKNNTVLVDPSQFGADIFDENGLLKKVELADGSNPYVIDKNDIFGEGDLTVRDTEGNVFKANPLTSQLSKTDSNGKKTHFAGDSFAFWLLNEWLPGTVVMALGAAGIFYTRQHMRNRHKNYLEYEELMRGKSR